MMKMVVMMVMLVMVGWVEVPWWVEVPAVSLYLQWGRLGLAGVDGGLVGRGRDLWEHNWFSSSHQFPVRAAQLGGFTGQLPQENVTNPGARAELSLEKLTQSLSSPVGAQGDYGMWGLLRRPGKPLNR